MIAAKTIAIALRILVTLLAESFIVAGEFSSLPSDREQIDHPLSMGSTDTSRFDQARSAFACA